MKELKWYISDDGTTKGTREEVEAYERGLNPIAKFKFPWSYDLDGGWLNAKGAGAFTSSAISADTTIALLNLMPLVEELRQKFLSVFGSGWRTCYISSSSSSKARDLLLDYEKALGIEVKS